MIQNDCLPAYCYHCGKKLKRNLREDVMSYAGNIHKSCNRERRRILHSLKQERLNMMMKNPRMRRLINKIDKKILKRKGLK